jgi:hypothetical protein
MKVIKIKIKKKTSIKDSIYLISLNILIEKNYYFMYNFINSPKVVLNI